MIVRCAKVIEQTGNPRERISNVRRAGSHHRKADTSNPTRTMPSSGVTVGHCAGEISSPPDVCFLNMFPLNQPEVMISYAAERRVSSRRRKARPWDGGPSGAGHPGQSLGFFAPVIEPTLSNGTQALVVAALTYQAK